DERNGEGEGWEIDQDPNLLEENLDLCLVADKTRIVKGSPLTFNNHLLVFAVLSNGMDPLEILLLKIGFWVQVHNLFNGMYLESMAKQFGDFIGEFVEYDAKSVAEDLVDVMIESCLNEEQPINVVDRKKKRPRLFNEGSGLRSPDLNKLAGLGNEESLTFSTAEPVGQENSSHVIFLIETKLDVRKMEKIRHKFGYGNGIDASFVGTRVGLSLGQKDGFDIFLQGYCANCIDVMLTDSEVELSWRFTGFYGAQERRMRA
ncbi:hypothetical protein Goari_002391, partial [Gossypium aridum]|nr:hypothetical protein [Gossypium aridum]